MKYKLKFETKLEFDTEDKFGIRERYKEFNDVCNKMDIGYGALYFLYTIEKTDKNFIKSDTAPKGKSIEYNNFGEEGYYEDVPDGFVCYVLGQNIDGYFYSYDIYFLIEKEYEDDFNNEIYEKIAEYSLLNDYRLRKTE